MTNGRLAALVLSEPTSKPPRGAGDVNPREHDSDIHRGDVDHAGAPELDEGDADTWSDEEATADAAFYHFKRVVGLGSFATVHRFLEAQGHSNKQGKMLSLVEAKQFPAFVRSCVAAFVTDVLRADQGSSPVANLHRGLRGIVAALAASLEVDFLLFTDELHVIHGIEALKTAVRKLTGLVKRVRELGGFLVAITLKCISSLTWRA